MKLVIEHGLTVNERQDVASHLPKGKGYALDDDQYGYCLRDSDDDVLTINVDSTYITMHVRTLSNVYFLLKKVFPKNLVVRLSKLQLMGEDYYKKDYYKFN